MLKHKWIVLLTLCALSCLSSRADEWMSLNGSNTFCRRLTETVVMRDPSSCGSTNVFCTIPVQCFQGSQNFVTTVMCRAERNTRSGCPRLQRCADDPSPQLGYESDLPRWDIQLDDMIFKSSLSGH